MCGFGGMAQSRSAAARSADLRPHLERMTQQLFHRGPDAQAVWLAADGSVGLAHTRLAIRDLSPAGAQPYTSRCGRWTLAYNGEIYNATQVAEALRAEGAPPFRGHSDTEVLVEAVAAWGVQEACERCAGMYAFAAVDNAEHQLHLVRDRVGIKPVVWAWAGGTLVFGSDTRILRGVPGAPHAVDQHALDRYLRLGRVEGERGLLLGVHKLAPGTMATWDLRTLTAGAAPTVKKWWDAGTALRAAQHSLLSGTDSQVLDAVEHTLAQCVAQHMVSDVPVGAFLSGGIDSSLVVALLRRVVGVPVRTFTIGFGNADHDESVHAAAVAAHLGTDHQTFQLDPDEALRTLDAVESAWDEPFADTSCIPTLIVSRLARQHVTVVLTGDGGDEVFGGYDRYVWLPRVTRLRQRLGGPGRALAARALAALARPATARAFSMAHPALPRSLRLRQVDRKAARMASALRAASNSGVHDATLECWPPEQLLVLGLDAHPAPPPVPGTSELRTYMLTDLERYLVDDILTKLDRATMAVSLEGRVPYLDHRVIELAMRLPDSMLVRNGAAKWVLRQLLARHVPAAMFERPKSGFTVPVGAWLRGPLRSWAEPLLRADRLRHAGVNPEPYLQAWQQHQAGWCDHSAALWAVLAYLRWRERAG
ncbi:MAG: asparagine synthase (glutamine-hydrolyzing) [Phycisphaerales bacterium]